MRASWRAPPRGAVQFTSCSSRREQLLAEALQRARTIESPFAHLGNNILDCQRATFCEHCACSAAGGCNRIGSDGKAESGACRGSCCSSARPSRASSHQSHSRGVGSRSLRRPRATDAGFSLDGVRDSLIRQEETIIFALIERAQYARNAEIYDRDAYATDVNKDRAASETAGEKSLIPRGHVLRDGAGPCARS